MVKSTIHDISKEHSRAACTITLVKGSDMSILSRQICSSYLILVACLVSSWAVSIEAFLTTTLMSLKLHTPIAEKLPHIREELPYLGMLHMTPRFAN